MTRCGGDKHLFELHAQVCRVLSSPRRLEIIHHLRDGEKTVSELVNATGYAKANLSQHLAVMRASGVLASRRIGRRILYRLAFPKMLRAYDLLREILFEQIREREKILSRVGRTPPPWTTKRETRRARPPEMVRRA
ncbi:MAG: helix-turn-helix transcriptional regulator [Nitrospirae bacterium]|nr:helix-turn-helix transcriptional regulator [Nitrospirota bacterium]